MTPVVIVACVVGVLIPLVVVLALAGSLLLALVSGLTALLVVALGIVLWLDTRNERKTLARRLRRVAAPLSGEAQADGEVPVEISVFRQQRPNSWLLDRIERRFSMLEADTALPKALGLAGLVAAVVCITALFARFGLASSLLSGLISWPAAGYAVLALFNSRRRAEFLRLFPEAVDHVVRLMRAGLPSTEAISTVAEEVQPPVSKVLGSIKEGTDAGLDPETVIRGTAARVRIPEFTLFASAVCLQRTTGGAISGALGNLSATLRARRETALKAQSATAQTRLTLMIVAAIPVAVLTFQQFTNPEAVEILFATDSGTSLLRYGIGGIVLGLLVARALAARVVR